VGDQGDDLDHVQKALVMTNEQMATAISRLIAAVNATYNSDDAEGLPAELWNANEAAAKAYLEWRAAEPTAEPIKALIYHIAKAGHVYDYEPIFESALAALNREEPHQ
jgi:hypothetical protein